MSRHHHDDIRIEDSEQDDYDMDDYQINNHRQQNSASSRQHSRHEYNLKSHVEEPRADQQRYSRGQPETQQSYNPHAYNISGSGDEDGEDYLNFSMPEPEQAPLTARELKKLNTPAPVPRATKAAMKKAEKAAAAADSGDPDYEPPRKIPANKAGEHQTLMMILQRYAASQRFAGLIQNSGVKLTNLESKTLAELKALQVRVRTICSSGTSTAGFVSGGIITACKVAACKIPKRYADLDGMGESLQADPEFMDISEMIELDIGFLTSMTPMQRMAWCLGKHAIGTNNMNRTRDSLIHKLMEQQAQARKTAAACEPTPPVAQETPIVQPNIASDPHAQQPIRSRAMPMYE